tara:strand:- start:726 stop:1256 length:531 start_codon:yes stop_codon:yes gene_type:complete
MAMAVNIDEIDFDGTSYQISFHDAIPDYTVNINSFNDTVAIDFDITTGSTTNNVDIDVVNEGIDIQNVGSYTFTQFEDYVISPTEDMFENLTVVMTIHHILTPNTDKTFDDNGSGDTFDPVNPNAVRKFWGTKCTQDVTPDGCWETSIDCQKYRFWFKVGPSWDNDPVFTGNPGCF